MNHTTLITDDDRRRLGTILETSYFHGGALRDRFRVLEDVIEDAQWTDAKDVPQDVVTMNATVKLRDVESQRGEIYNVIYPEHADLSLNQISVLAPIATAIFGRHVGDVSDVTLPSGQLHVRLESVQRAKEMGSGRSELSKRNTV